MKPRDDLPPLQLGQVRERWHTGVQRSVAQDPEQSAGRSLMDVRAVEGRDLASSFAILAVAGSAFSGVKFGARSPRLLVTLLRIALAGGHWRGLLNQASSLAPCHSERANKQ